jgi:hypothetical protein
MVQLLRLQNCMQGSFFAAVSSSFWYFLDKVSTTSLFIPFFVFYDIIKFQLFLHELVLEFPPIVSGLLNISS